MCQNVYQVTVYYACFVGLIAFISISLFYNVGNENARVEHICMCYVPIYKPS